MIRLIEREDLEWLRGLRNNPEVNLYFNQSHYLSKKEQENWYDNCVLSGEFHSFIVEDDNCKMVGYVSLKDFNYILHSAEFSICVDPKERRKGYGKEALLFILKYGFENLNLHRIYSTVFSFNKAEEFYRKIGFREEALLRDTCFKMGSYWSSYYISMTQDEYKKIYHSEQ